MMVRDRAFWVLLPAVACLAWAGVWAQEGRDEDLALFASVLQPAEAVLCYEVEAQGVYLQVITSTWIRQPSFLPYPREELLSDVVALRDALELQWQYQWRVLSLEPLLTRLYTKLVQPGLDALAQQGLLKEITTLVIIPSGPLWYVPFSALLMIDRPPIKVGRWLTRDPYLVEHYNLAFLPSLQELLHLEEGQTHGRTSSAVISRCPDWIGCPWIHPATLVAVGQLPGGEPVRTYEGQHVTTEGLVRELAEARYLILLVPTRTESENPWLSSLLLIDAPYELWEVAATSAQGMELVVIPTYDAISDLLYRRSQPTLRTPFIPAATGEASPLLPPLDGLDASTWYAAFRTAGAQGVLRTSWCANIQAFQDLFHRLCSYRAAGHSWAEALAQAQRDLIQNTPQVSPFANPWFWAPYQLVGRWR